LKAGTLAEAEAFDVNLTSFPATRKARVLEQVLLVTGSNPGAGLKLIGTLPAPLATGLTRDETVALVEALGKLGTELSFKPGTPRPENLPGRLSEVPKGVEGCPSKGPADAPIVIVEFTEFQCPFCKRVVPTIDELHTAYPEDVRLHVCQLPLAFHKRARPAAQAAYAAHQQGKYWEYYEVLWQNNKQLEDSHLEEYAQQIGLNLPRWKTDFNSSIVLKHVDHQANLGAAMGVTGTPNFFVNGENVRGAKPFEHFKKVIDKQLVKAKKLEASGTPRGQIARLMASGAAGGVYRKYVLDGVKPSKSAPPAPKAPKQPLAVAVEKISLEDSPRIGTGDKVILAEFSDFQCPYCSKVGGLLKDVQKKLGDDASLVFKHFPLSFHKDAQLAAEASMAAHAQGKFWEMHDKMFANQRKLKRPDLESYAEELGLDMPKFKAALDSGEYTARVKADITAGHRANVGGTPSIYINGRKYQGPRSPEAILDIINQEILK
jgi:protein-disulfide isomerase